MMKTIMRTVVLSAGLVALTAPGAMAGEVSEETVAKILANLGKMQCEVDPENIEADGDGYELDDVFCADGQYDMDLNAALDVVEKRKE
jgi:pectin methylesterase-like acyl-CoA thioesterase